MPEPTAPLPNPAPRPDVEEHVRDRETPVARFRTFRLTYGAYVYWAVEVYLAGELERVEVARADLATQDAVEARAEAWAHARRAGARDA